MTVPDPNNPVQGAGTVDVTRIDQAVNTNINTNASANANGIPSTGTSRLQEILPAGSSLLNSMQVIPGAPATASALQERAAANPACVVVTFRPDAQRPATTLVDFTGDGLILSAVPDAHIQQVFARSGYNTVDTSKPARWCIAQTAARELVQVRASAPGQVASVLVQTNSGWQLMTQSQWAQHQTALAQTVASSALIQKRPAANITRTTAQRSSTARAPAPARSTPRVSTVAALSATPKLK